MAFAAHRGRFFNKLILNLNESGFVVCGKWVFNSLVLWSISPSCALVVLVYNALKISKQYSAFGF